MSFTSATLLQLEWQPPLHDGGSPPLVCYRVYWREMFCTTWTEEGSVAAGAGTSSQLLVNDLMPGNEYEFKVLDLNICVRQSRTRNYTLCSSCLPGVSWSL